MPLVLVRPSVLRYPRDLRALVHTVPHIRQTAPDFRLPRTGLGPETVVEIHRALETKSESGLMVKDCLLSQISIKLSSLENDLDCQISTFLDPRFFNNEQKKACLFYVDLLKVIQFHPREYVHLKASTKFLTAALKTMITLKYLLCTMS
ncbi:UNVERIFIED_CONTAM: hypothetical protein FKN15_025494 [Acipenser sinensis]